MYSAECEDTGERLCGFFDEDDLISEIEKRSDGIWDVYRDGRLEYYYVQGVI